MEILYQVRLKEFLVFYKTVNKRTSKTVEKLDYNATTKQYEKVQVLLNPIAAGSGEYVKVNFNSLYSTKVHYATYQKIFAKMKSQIRTAIFKQPRKKLVEEVKTRIIVRIPENYGNVKMIKDTLSKNNIPVDFDIGNGFMLWFKPFEDAIQDAGIIPNDNYKYVRGTGELLVEFIDDFDKRELVFQIIKYDSRDIVYLEDQK